MSTKRILVSRSLPEDSLLLAWCAQQNISVTAKSFIAVAPVLKLKIPATDWIFFVSPKGAETYLAHYPIFAKKVAALGPATEKAIVKMGVEADFIGDEQLDPTKVANAFVRETKRGESVFFPLSQRSHKTVSRKVKRSRKVIEFITYQTTLKPAVFLDDFDVILFTSPSNAEGFLQLNTIGKVVRIIAIGETTGQFIRDKGLGGQLYVAKENTEKGMLEVLKELIILQ
jgi:hydroxymethylbilane synthase